MSSFQKDLPYFAEGPVVAGFGRGGKELGVPTANFPEDVVHHLPASFECGVYYGWAKLCCDDSVRKMVMSVGWNPYYHNTVKTMETHIMHKYDSDFYGKNLKVAVLGYIRPMTDFDSLGKSSADFDSLGALIAAIQNDISEANKRLEDPSCMKYIHDPFFISPPISVPSSSESEHTSHSIGTPNSILPSLPPSNPKNSDTKSNTNSENSHQSCNGDIKMSTSCNIETCVKSKILTNSHSKAEDSCNIL